MVRASGLDFLLLHPTTVASSTTTVASPAVICRRHILCPVRSSRPPRLPNSGSGPILRRILHMRAGAHTSLLSTGPCVEISDPFGLILILLSQIIIHCSCRRRRRRRSKVRKVPIETPSTPHIESCAKEQTNERTTEWRIVVVKKPKGVTKSGIELKS